jgi:hypothetical protein
MKHYAMKMYGEWTYRLILFTSALVGGEWSFSRPGRFISRETASGTHCIGRLVGPRVPENVASSQNEQKWTPVRVKTMLRPAVSRPLLVSGTHLGSMTRFITFVQLRVCWYGAQWLTRGKKSHEVEVELKFIYYRRSVGQSVLVSGSHPESMIRFLFYVWQLWVFYVERPLWQEDESVICSYDSLWALPEQSLWGSHRIHDHSLLSHLRLPEPGGPGPRIYIPGHWVPFSLPLTTRRATMEVF